MTNQTQRRPLELLAPAGDPEALRAAVANGADAVYFGLPNFNARRRAANFSLEELPATIAYLHNHNVRGYVTVNTLIFPEELAAAARYIEAIAAAGADAVIVQDLGLMRLMHRLVPDLPIHASTQASQTEPRGLELLRSLGVQRVILARELSLDQVRIIAGSTTMELEVFVHGALCISYSGQCLASRLLFDRSANRGQCAQACRLPYQLIVDDEPVDLADRRFLLSPQDLAAYEMMEDLVDAGVTGFKIEGRLKGPTYVAAAVSVYRAALDAARQRTRYALSRKEELELAQSFSRGFTKGFLGGTDHQQLVRGQSPKSRGLRVGVVAGHTNRGVLIKFDGAAAKRPEALPLNPGDGVMFEEGLDQSQEQGGRIYTVAPIRHSGRRAYAVHGGAASTVGPQLYELTFGHEALIPAKVIKGAVVWKTDDPKLRRQLETTYSRDLVVHPRPIRMRVWAEVGQPLRVVALDADGSQAEAVSAAPLARAERHPLTTALAREQLSRLGGTPFSLEAVELFAAGDQPVPELPVMAPKSLLNEVRREVIEKLMAVRAAQAPRTPTEPAALDHLHQEMAARRLAAAASSRPADDAAQLYLLVRSWEQLEAAARWWPTEGFARPALVYCDFSEPGRDKDAVSLGRDAGLAVGLATPRIVKPGEEQLVESLLECAPAAALVRNLAGLSLLRDLAPQLPLIGDHSLNAANELAVDLLIEFGLRRVTPSPDLTWDQVVGLASIVPAGRLELIAQQHMPMFHMEHCLLAANRTRGHSRRDCGRPCRQAKVDLEDRNAERHPVLVDAACRNTVYSAAAQTTQTIVPNQLAAGLRHFRVELVRESPEETVALLEQWSRLIKP